MITKNEVEKLVKSLKNSLSYGRDDLDSISIKMGINSLCEPIAHIINLSLGSGTFPAKWKMARIIPLRKSADLNPKVPESYRPVSQLCVVSKITEKWVQSQLLSHLESTNQIHQNHHAYRELLSTTTAMIQVMDYITEATDRNEITATISVDQSAAFDCVVHGILIEKMRYYKIGDQTINWLKSYLKYRSSYVNIGSANSKIMSTKCGVPQGSVLGPALYLLYVNELPCIPNKDNDDENEDDFCQNIEHRDRTKLFGHNCKECGMMTVYADDGVYAKSSNYRIRNQDYIEDTFWKLKHYLNANGLLINESKTTITEFMTKQKRGRIPGIPPDLTIQEIVDGRTQDKLITESSTCRMLGANIRNTLSWEGHLEGSKKSILPAIRRKIGALNSIRKLLSFKARLQIADSLIMGQLGYLICLWGNTTDNQTRKAQITQNMAARFVTGQKRITRTEDLIKTCNWLNIKELTEYHSMIHIWKTIKWGKPEYLRGKLRTDEEDKITTDNPRLQLTAGTFRWKAVDEWRMLPETVTGQTEYLKFKRELKDWIKDRRSNHEPD